MSLSSAYSTGSTQEYPSKHHCKMFTEKKRISLLIWTGIGNINLGNLAQCAETFLKPIKFDVSFLNQLSSLYQSLVTDRSQLMISASKC